MDQESFHYEKVMLVQKKQLLTIAGGSIGHFIEWYDWSIYGLLAAVFADQIFPGSSRSASLVASYSAFAVGFIGRPIGALVLSPLADRYGRRPLLSLTIAMAGLGSLIIGVCPTYKQMGIAAPLLVIAARVLQGISSGGEFQIAIAFLNEHGSSKHRALSASAQMVSIGLSILFATGIAAAVTRYLSSEATSSWGWRLPFLLGALLSLFGLYMRTGVEETPAFKMAARSGKARVVRGVLGLMKYPREAFVVFVIQMNTVQYYIWLIFLPSYANIVGGLPRAEGFLGNVAATIAYCGSVPVFAAISDRVGRKPLLMAAALCFLVFTFPLLGLLVGNLSFATYLIVAVAGALFIAANNAVIGTVFAELFPTEVRVSGIGIPYAICAAIFGGTAPILAMSLHGHGGPLYISIYIMAISAVTLLTHIFVTPETMGRPVDDVCSSTATNAKSILVRDRHADCSPS